MKSSAEKIWMAILSAIIILFTFFNAYQMTVTHNMTQAQLNIANMLLGYTFGLSNLVVGYYFVSSVSSREKTKYMNNLLEDSMNKRRENRDSGEYDFKNENGDLEKENEIFLKEKNFHE